MVSPAYALQVAAVAAAYFGAAKLGLDLAFATSSVTAIWPPTGIALAAIVIGGYRMWPAVALGALLANVDTGVPAVTVLGITAGNTLEALAGGYLLRRFGFRPSLARVRDVLALVALGAVASTTVSATIGVGSLIVGDEVDFGDSGPVWRTWWLGDMGGDLLVAPALLIAASHRPFEVIRRRALEATCLAAALVGVSVFVFDQSTSFIYVVFPLLIWAALRFLQPGAAAGSLVVAVIAVWATANERGPFAMSGPDERLLLAQTFVGVGSVTALMLAAVTSERQRAERTVRDVATSLQESLLPRRLPEVPGLETASYFRPAGREQRVGGDFYDLFPTGDGAWAVAIGDVCGKGARAAGITALVRYTLRAGAVHEPAPSRVLGLLNEAMRREHEGREFCTVAYARLEPQSGTVGITFSAGGHPLPLVLRADGSVEQLGRSGTLLGIHPNPDLTDANVELGEGEALFLYTDGLLDAYAPERPLEIRALEAILGRCAGRPPAGVIAEVEHQVLARGGAEPRDDIAIVVLRVGRRDSRPG